MPATDHYQTLGIRRDADQKEIKERYRWLSQRLHPDKLEPHDRQTGTEVYARITEAYDTLSDPERRRQHDLELAGGFDREELRAASQTAQAAIRAVLTGDLRTKGKALQLLVTDRSVQSLAGKLALGLEALKAGKKGP